MDWREVAALSLGHVNRTSSGIMTFKTAIHHTGGYIPQKQLGNIMVLLAVK